MLRLPFLIIALWLGALTGTLGAKIHSDNKMAASMQTRMSLIERGLYQSAQNDLARTKLMSKQGDLIRLIAEKQLEMMGAPKP